MISIVFIYLFLLIIIGTIITCITIKLIEYFHKQRKKNIFKKIIIIDDFEVKIINSDEIYE